MKLKSLLPFIFFHLIIGATPSLLVPFYEVIRIEVFGGRYFLLSLSEGLYILFFGTFSILWGALSIGFNRRRLLLIAIVLFDISLIITIISINPILFIIGRISSGLCLAAGYPIISSIISDNYNSFERTKIFSILILSEITGTMIFPSISLLLYGFNISWRFSLTILFVIGIIDSILMFNIKENMEFLEDIIKMDILGRYARVPIGIRRVLKTTNILLALQAFFGAFSGFILGKWLIFYLAIKFSTSITVASFSLFLSFMVYFTYIISKFLDNLKKERRYACFSAIVGIDILAIGVLYLLIALIPSAPLNYSERNILIIIRDIFTGKFLIIIVSNLPFLITLIVLGAISLLSGVPSPATLSIISDTNLLYERSLAVSLLKIFESIGSGLGFIIAGLLLDLFAGDFLIVIYLASILLIISSLFWLILAKFIDDEVYYNMILGKKLQDFLIKRKHLISIYVI